MTKGPLLQKFWDELPDSRKKAIQARAKQKIEAYEKLQAVRKAAGLTQTKIAQELQIPQDNVSRLEKESDLLLSTLQDYIKAIGGKLHLTIELPGQPAIPLNSLTDLIENQDGGEHPQLP